MFLFWWFVMQVCITNSRHMWHVCVFECDVTGNRLGLMSRGDGPWTLADLAIVSFFFFSFFCTHSFIMASLSLSLTLGLLPPMAPGRIEPVSWYRHRILETQPWETLSCREMTQGRMPWCAISTILCRMWLGSGLPLMNTPPSWFTRPWPRGVDTAHRHRNTTQHIGLI